MLPRLDRTGQIFGKYEIKEFLGQGGFAEVYRGVHTHIPQQQAAIKILIKQLVQSRTSQFEQEAQIIATLRHPNIVRMYDYDIYSNLSQTTTLVPYIVMDYIPGGSARQNYPRGTRLDFRNVVTYVQQVAMALQYAHDVVQKPKQGIMHLDVKPENMLLGEQGQILLSDFGLARFFSSKELLTDIQGTVSYMSPEQFEGKPGFASDQYALGIVAYEWLCGHTPFKGKTIEEIQYNHQYTLPPSLRSQIAGLPPEVEMVIMRALKKNPLDRYAKVSDFARELEGAFYPQAAVVPGVPAPNPVLMPNQMLPNPGPGPQVFQAPGLPPAPQPLPATESFFRPLGAQPAPDFSFNRPIPGNPDSLTIARPGVPPPPSFPRPQGSFMTPYPSGPSGGIEEVSSGNRFRQLTQEIIRPEQSSILHRQKQRLYGGLGLHALGAIFIGIWSAQAAPSSGHELAWWLLLLSLLCSLSLFALFFISRNSSIRLSAIIFLAFYWALVGAAFSTVLGGGARLACFPDPTISFTLFLFGSAGFFLWVLFKKKS
jgi:serine/threonine protein kinase